MTPFEQFKLSEYKGDLLLNLVVRDILLSRGVARTSVSNIARQYTTNEFLAGIFDALGLEKDPRDIAVYQKEFKAKGNVVEVYFWEYFENNGYIKTVNHFAKFMKE